MPLALLAVTRRPLSFFEDIDKLSCCALGHDVSTDGSDAAGKEKCPVVPQDIGSRDHDDGPRRAVHVSPERPKRPQGCFPGRGGRDSQEKKDCCAPQGICEQDLKGLGEAEGKGGRDDLQKDRQESATRDEHVPRAKEDETGQRFRAEPLHRNGVRKHRDAQDHQDSEDHDDEGGPEHDPRKEAHKARETKPNHQAHRQVDARDPERGRTTENKAAPTSAITDWKALR